MKIKTYIHTMGFPAKLAIVGMTSFVMMSGAMAQLYAPGSVTDNILNFNNGADGAALPPVPAGIGINNTPATGSGGGWDLSAAGANNVLGLTSTRAQTQVLNNTLLFNIVNGGAVGDLAGVNLLSSWSATATVTGSNSFTNPGNQYIYQFDAAINASVLSLTPGVFDAITLTIRNGANTIIYQESDLGDILGLVSLTGSTYNDAQVAFAYDPTTGPLSITWSADTTVGANLFGGAGDNLYSVSGGAILAVPVPEPTGAVLIGITGLLALMRRHRIV